MTELMRTLQHISPALAVGAASLGAAILASARDRIANSVVTRGHAFLDQTLRYRQEGEEEKEGGPVMDDGNHEDDEQADALAQLSDDERELVHIAAGQAAGATLAIGTGAVAVKEFTMHGGKAIFGGVGTAGQDAP